MISSAAASDTTPKAYFGVLLRRWRVARRIGQLTLALDANISTRNSSCVETGRAQPSRDMVLRLAEALEIALRAGKWVVVRSAGAMAKSGNES
jgi:transcriptional regulator with XRE-family HTH domain